MNIYKGLLYTQGYLLDPQYADDATPRYADGYGNRIANERAFPRLGHARASAPAAAPPPVEVCTAGACG